MAWLMAGIVGTGFLVSVYGVLTNPKAAFYLLHARLWELAAGGFLIFAPRLRNRWLDTSCSQRAHDIDVLEAFPEIEFVMLAARWSAYLTVTYRNQGDPRSAARGLELLKEGLEEFVTEIAPLRRRIILLGEMPQMGFDPIPCVILQDIQLWRDQSEREHCLAMTASIPRSSFLERQSATNAVLRSVAVRHPGMLAVFPTDEMCRPDCITSIGGEFLFRDSSHLRRNMSVDGVERLVAL